MPIDTTSSFISPREDLREVGMEAISTEGFVGLEFFPEYQVDKQSGQGWFQTAKSRMQRGGGPMDRNGGSAVGQRRRLQLTSKSYECVLYEREIDYTEFDEAKFDSIVDFEIESVSTVTLEMQRGHEYRCLNDNLFNTTTWSGSSNTLAVVNEWDDPANCTPVDDIIAGNMAIKGKCGQLANLLGIGLYTYYKLCLSEQIRDKLGLKHAGNQENALIALPDLARALNVPRIVVGEASVDTANEGQAMTLDTMWNNEYAFLARVGSGPLVGGPTLGRTFVWRNYAGILRVRQYEERGGTRKIVAVEQCTDEVVLNTSCGFLFSNIKT